MLFKNKTSLNDRMKGMFIGLAIGDTLGMPLEFKQKGSFEPLTDLGAGGPFNLPLGYWTDDTSMAYCLADSFYRPGGYDSYDVMSSYVNWRDNGAHSSTGVCFDIGNQTTEAISRYLANPNIRESEPRSSSAGNGCIMRLAPVVIASSAAGNSLAKTLFISKISARETHYSSLAEDATEVFAYMLVNALTVNKKSDIMRFDDSVRLNATIKEVIFGSAKKQEDELKPTGYVIDTLEVATWAFMNSTNFKDGALKAVNLGGDSDTIGAVYGQLAGAYYGISSIPEKWLSQLHKYTLLLSVADELAKTPDFDLIMTRFYEDYSEKSPFRPIKPMKKGYGEGFDRKDADILSTWSSVGSPGQPPTEPFVPTEKQLTTLYDFSKPEKIQVDWAIDADSYKRLCYGHLAQEMEDKWNIYTDKNNVVHMHRSWTGYQTFSFSIKTLDKNTYSITSFTVEQDGSLYKLKDREKIIKELKQVLRSYFQINVN